MDKHIKELIRVFDEDTTSHYTKSVTLVGDYNSPFIKALRNKAKRLGVTHMHYSQYILGMCAIIDVETAEKPTYMRLEDDIDNIMPEHRGMSAVSRAIFELLCCVGVRGRHVVIVGRGHAVKGLATMLLMKDASVTICHSRTQYLHDSTMSGDILVVATPPDADLEDLCVYNKSIIIDVGNALHGTIAAKHENYIDGYKLGPLTTSILLNRCVDHDDD